MVYRIYVEKTNQFAVEAKAVENEIITLLGVKNLTNLRLLNRYDVEGITKELFEQSVSTVFSEPQLDVTYTALPETQGEVFAVEYLPGQFDQRAASAAECIQLISMGARPAVQTARVYILEGNLTEQEIVKIKKYLINTVEARQADLAEKETIEAVYPAPADVAILTGFISMNENELKEFIADYSLAMDSLDIAFCQEYFKKENREPTITEIRMIDTYWSDHCRHTTFGTTIDAADIDDETVKKAFERYITARKNLSRTKPMNFMDIATMGTRVLKSEGAIPDLDESEEINACTIKIKVDVDGKDEDWLYLFKNETHNHPTEIEPFGGAATCIGGAIRDPLSGRSYVYQAMRVTGAADPLLPISETLEGKLPQRKIVTTAAAGYSSYGNQIGLATGQVDEIYHAGYVAKRMEVGAVVGAAPAKNVRREVPEDGDVVILLGGRTGRDGCGGATGSSKAHKLESLETCGAEVQKGNAPIERRLQRLFRDGEVTKLIKRCNDFGAGGVAVAIGELADGLLIELDTVTKKYDGLDGTELAISESQERMAVVVEKKDAEDFIKAANAENLEATVVATVTASPRLVMNWRGKQIVDISREFLDSNGAEKHINIKVEKSVAEKVVIKGNDFSEKITNLVTDLNVCSKKGLGERFDSTIGAGTVLMPFGGVHQETPTQVMAAKLPVLTGNTNSCSGMAYGYNPYITSQNCYTGAYLAVVESVSKLVAAGFSHNDVWLSFQEYFEKLGTDPKRWGKPFAALLGGLDAQLDLGVAAIGGKDSMSGSFEDFDVPPTLISFATAIGSAGNIASPEFKLAGSKVILLKPAMQADGILPDPESLKLLYEGVEELIESEEAISVWTPTFGGIAEGLFKMCLGNRIGFELDESVDADKLFEQCYGGFIVELAGDDDIGIILGVTTEKFTFKAAGDTIDLFELKGKYEGKLESVYPCNILKTDDKVETFTYPQPKYTSPKITVAKPKILIPVFPGTNCEYDSARAVNRAGGQADTFIINNLTPQSVAQSVEELVKRIKSSQAIFLPGGFSGGDEPDGSAKFITAVMRNPAVAEAVNELLKERDGLMLGICNGFQALIKLGLLPFGEIIDTDDTCPTLTFNTIGRHQSGLVTTRVSSNKSPWLRDCNVGDIHKIAISHGEGRFVCEEKLLRKLAANGQIACQYVGEDSLPSMDISTNPNGSLYSIEAISSPDGRILGKMGHTERSGEDLYRNVSGNKYQPLFESGIRYFK